MRKKVAHISGSKALEDSRTITRNLAKDGLMEDGQEELLARTSKVQNLGMNVTQTRRFSWEDESLL
jgi:hypothetical protein